MRRRLNHRVHSRFLESQRAAMGIVILVLGGCGADSEHQPSRHPSEYKPLTYVPSRSTSRISEEIRAMRSVKQPVVSRTRFTELTDSGIDFTYQNGAKGEALMVEATGGGCGWLDYDLDGRPDLYLVQGGNPAAPPTSLQPNDGLYRNLMPDQFQDVAELSGIEERGYGQGVAIGDFDNDGFDDLYVTNVGTNTLFWNCGDGTFKLIEYATEPPPRCWSSSAAWGDIDRDGDLDLYVCHYCVYDPMQPKPCFRQTGEPGTCHPKDVEPYPDECYLNEGNGQFRPVARERGLFGEGNRALGVVIADFDNDDWPDIYIANDTTSNFLFINRGNGSFDERAAFMGCAVNINGSPQASMGIASGDYDRNGFLDLYVTHFHNEWNTLYQNLGPNGFHDVTAREGLALPTMQMLGFGTVMADFDQNGYAELIVANGHIDDVRSKGIEFEMNSQLFAYNGSIWDEVTANGGSFFQEKRIGRGIASADFDGDGDLDVAFVSQNKRMSLLRNDSQRGHWLQLRFIGSASNRRGIGTRVIVKSGSTEWMQELTGGTSYCVTHESILNFGLGDSNHPCTLTIRWPSGKQQVLQDIRVDQMLTIREPGDSNPQ